MLNYTLVLVLELFQSDKVTCLAGASPAASVLHLKPGPHLEVGRAQIGSCLHADGKALTSRLHSYYLRAHHRAAKLNSSFTLVKMITFSGCACNLRVILTSMVMIRESTDIVPVFLANRKSTTPCAHGIVRAGCQS